jgi:hypothetical protein
MIDKFNNTWISIKEKVPPYNMDVLVYTSTWQIFWGDRKNISVGRRLSSTANREEFYIKGHEDGKTKVTHWMLLPEMPNKNGKI